MNAFDFVPAEWGGFVPSVLLGFVYYGTHPWEHPTFSIPLTSEEVNIYYRVTGG